MNEQEVIQQIAEAEGLIEEALETLEGTVPVQVITKTNPWLLLGVALVAGSAGVALGYQTAKRRLQPMYENAVREEIAQTREYYARLNKAGPYETPAKAAQALLGDGAPEEELTEQGKQAVEAMLSYQGRHEKDDVPTEELEDGSEVEVHEPTSENIFLEGQPLNLNDFDLDAEAENRASGKPYVITSEEFYTNEPEHEQINATWYEKDLTLADERDEIIPDDRLVGADNLKRFGHGSGDRNVVFIRNEDREQDFEIVRSRGSFAKEVLGLDEEETSSRNTRKSRGDGD